MSRVAVVVPRARLRAALIALAASGLVELSGPLAPAEGAALDALRRVERNGAGRPEPPCLAVEAPDLADLERRGARGLLTGEIELDRHLRSAVAHGSFAALVGWTPTECLPALSERLDAVGATVQELPRPTWADPPTLLRSTPASRAFAPLVETYGAVSYASIDPTPFAAAAFVAMFGLMFADVGHGLLLVVLAIGLRRALRPGLAAVRRLWALLAACGAAAAAAGLLYGEAFGPTGIVPTLWISPTDEPILLMSAAIGVGAVLLSAGYAVGIVNRWREAGALAALVAPSGIAGACVFVGLGLGAGGVLAGRGALLAAGGALVGVGALLLGAGFRAEAGRGAAAATEATVEVLDSVLRVGTNVVSFARLAAFGLVHAAIGAVVLDAARSLASGAIGWAAAAAVFVAGNALAFALGLLVAGIQALRLEYYELFSRVFAAEGRRFRPWSVPTTVIEEETA